jgi:hypothetical protein
MRINKIIKIIYYVMLCYRNQLKTSWEHNDTVYLKSPHVPVTLRLKSQNLATRHVLFTTICTYNVMESIINYFINSYHPFIK